MQFVFNVEPIKLPNACFIALLLMFLPETVISIISVLNRLVQCWVYLTLVNNV